MLDNYKCDLKRYFRAHHGGRYNPKTIAYAFFEMSLWAIAVFRFGKWAQRMKFTPLSKILLFLYFLMYKIVEATSGIRIAIKSEIGKGLVIHNFGGILICGKLGDNVSVIQGAQIVARADGKGKGWPTIGNNVHIGCGAKVLGDVKIGHHVRIGANAVVVKDVPDYSIVMPPECRVIRGFYKKEKGEGLQKKEELDAS